MRGKGMERRVIVRNSFAVIHILKKRVICASNTRWDRPRCNRLGYFRRKDLVLTSAGDIFTPALSVVRYLLLEKRRYSNEFANSEPCRDWRIHELLKDFVNRDTVLDLRREAPLLPCNIRHFRVLLLLALVTFPLPFAFAPSVLSI
jgi:hypothetical protein